MLSAPPALMWKDVGIFLDLYVSILSSMAGVVLILPGSEGTPKCFLTDGKDGLGWDFAVWADCWGCAGSSGCTGLWFMLEMMLSQGNRGSLSSVCSSGSRGKNSSFTSFQQDRKKMCQFSLYSCSITYFFGEAFKFYITQCRNWDGVFCWWVKLESIFQHLLRSNL